MYQQDELARGSRELGAVRSQGRRISNQDGRHYKV